MPHTILRKLTTLTLSLALLLTLTACTKNPENPTAPTETTETTPASDPTTPTEPTPTETETEPGPTPHPGVQFPCIIEDGKLLVESVFPYTGMNPDADLDFVTDSGAIALINLSQSYLRSAEITVTTLSGIVLTFHVEDLKPGRIVWAFANEEVTISENEPCLGVSSDAVFQDEPDLMADWLTCEVEGMEVRLTNISDSSLSGLEIACHCLFDDFYFGGKCQNYPVETIAPGETVTVLASDSFLGEAELMRIQPAG